MRILNKPPIKKNKSPSLARTLVFLQTTVTTPSHIIFSERFINSVNRFNSVINDRVVAAYSNVKFPFKPVDFISRD